MKTMRRLKQCIAYLLVAVMIISTGIPSSVSATGVSNSTYSSRNYSVNGVTAYAYDGSDLSQEGLTFLPIEDNKELAKALYYAYGSLGYSKEYTSFNDYFSAYEAVKNTDKLAVSEMVLTKLMDADENAYDDMTKDYLAIVNTLPEYDSSVFAPYYILSAESEIVGYTSTSTEKYETPVVSEEVSTEETSEASTEETSEDTSTEDVTAENTETSTETAEEDVTSESTTEAVSSDVTTEELTEVSTEKSSEEKNFEKADGTYEDGIRNRNKGTLAKVLGENVNQTSVLEELAKHWNDDTYLGRTEFEHYDFVSTLLSNVSDKDVDESVFEFAKKNNLEVYQETGTISEILFDKMANGLTVYYNTGDIFVISDGENQYTGVFASMSFYDENLASPNEFCFYDEVKDYSPNAEQDVKDNAYAWIWHNGEKVVLEPIPFKKEITLSVIKLNREGLSISADGSTLSNKLDDGSVVTFNQTPAELATMEENADNKFTANATISAGLFDGANFGFSNDVTLVSTLQEPVKHASYIDAYDLSYDAGDGAHAYFYWRNKEDAKHGDNEDCQYCASASTLGVNLRGTSQESSIYFCRKHGTKYADGKPRQRLITCGKATLDNITTKNNGFAGATMKIKTVGKGMYKEGTEKYEQCNIDTAKGIGDLIREDVLVNSSVFKEDTAFTLSYCRDAGLQVPDPNTSSHKTGFYEMYLGDLYEKDGNLVYVLNILWYSEYTLLHDENAVQRLCGTFTVEQPALPPITPEKKSANIKIKKIVTPGTSGSLADGTYKFELSDSNKNKIKDYSVTVTNGVSSVATIDLGAVFSYSKKTETAHGSTVGVTYTPVVSDKFYLREIACPQGAGPINNSRYVPIVIENAPDYLYYLNEINDYNQKIYNGEGAYANRTFTIPEPMVECVFLDRDSSTTGDAYMYPNNETFGAAAFLKTVKNNCKNIVAGNENYSLEGAEYTIYTSNTGDEIAQYYPHVVYHDMSQMNTQDEYVLVGPSDAVFTTDANGNFVERTNSNASVLDGKIVMKPGTYYIEETKAPKGYMRTPGRQAFTITNGVYNTSVTLVEDVAVDPLQIVVTKTLTGGQQSVGDVNVAGVDFLVEFFSDAALSKKLYQATFTTNTDGQLGLLKRFLKNGTSTFANEFWSNTGELNFPAGYIRVTEVNRDNDPSVGTLTTGTIYWQGLNDVISIEDGVVIKVEVASSSPREERNDAITFSYVSGGSIITDQNEDISVTSERPKRFDVCFKKQDEDGIPMAGIPFIIENTTTGEKHLVVSDAKGYVTTKRSDVVFTSAEATQGVALDSLKSAEDPYYNSLDSYITDQTADALVNNELLPAPIWFYGTSDDVTKLDAAVYADYQKERDTETYHGSLIYAKDATYTVYELDTKASNGKQLVKRGEITFGCDVDGELKPITDGLLDATIINYDAPAIKTLSRDLSTQQKFSKQAENVTIIDTFEVTNVKYNTPYTVKGVLVATRDSVINGTTYHAGELIKDTDGKYVTAHSSFTTDTTDKNGNAVDSKHYSSQKNNTYTSVDDELTSARTSLIYTMNTLGFETCGAVWYTYLCEGIEDKDLVITDGVVDKEASNVIREWTISEENGYYDYVEDENLANESEFVEVVCIDTDAWTPVHNTNVQKADKETEIFDDVRINGLIAGETYTLISKLIDPESGEEVIANDGNACVGLIDGTTDTFTFTPDETGNHNLCVTYPKFDSTPYVGKSVVCFQYIYDANGILLGESTQLTNTRETVYFPEAYTTAMGVDNNKIIPQYGEITINDTVHYAGLSVGKEYVVTGTLHYLDKEGVEQTVHYKDGSEVVSSVTFTAETPTGDILVPFTFNIEDIKENVWDWEKTVVFEDISYNGNSVITHADIKDKGQTVYFPSLHTSLREKETGVQHLDTYDKQITLVDTVSYSNLEPGKTYRIIGKLINQETGEVIKNNGKEVTATRVFTPQYNGENFAAEATGDNTSSENATTEQESSEATTEDETTNNTPNETPTEPSTENNEENNTATEEESVGVSGTIELVFTFNGKDAGLIAEDGHNAPIVAYEYLYDNFDLETVGEDPSSDEDENEEPSTEEESTTPPANNEEQTEATPSVKIEIISTEENHTDIYSNVTLWSVHTDKTDVKQTVTIPSGHTTLLDNALKEHTASMDEVVTLVDTVAYRGLLPGKEYTVTGVLYIPKEQANEVELTLVKKDENGKECCPLLDENGQMIQGSTTFVAETADGSVDVTFTFKRSLITKEKSKVVAFEDMSYGEEGIVFTHADIDDSDQTVQFPSVHTTALSEDTRDHFAGTYITAKIIDSVQVGGLIPNREYKLVGTLMNKANGSVLKQDGLPIVAETVFETSTQDKTFNGTIDVAFSFDASIVKGKSAVVFEKLYLRKLDENGQKTDEWIEVGRHEDITDEGQTVHFSDLRTKASEKDTGDKKVDAKKKLQLVDTVTYKNLIPGKEYTITGMLMVIPEGVKASDLDTVEIKDGKTLADYAFTYDAKKNVYIDENGYKCKALKVDGEPVTSTKTFTPTEPNGSIDLVFTIDASKLAGQTIVVFEDLYVNDIKVGTHANITDKGQTIKIETDTPGDDTPSIDTGDTFPLIPMIVLAIMFFAGMVGLVVGRKKFLKK